MTLKLKVLGGLLLAAALASAFPLCAPSGTYADLMAMGACTINDKLFSDFNYTPTATGGATVVPAESFAYRVLDMGPSAIGFAFQFALSALPGQSNDIMLHYNVESLAGASIISNHLVMTGRADGNAFAAVAETYCPGGLLTSCPGSTGGLSTFNSPMVGTKLDDKATFPAVKVLSVSKDINVTAGAGGFANISGVMNFVDQNVPEPISFVMIGSGLTLLGWFGTRSRRKQS